MSGFYSLDSVSYFIDMNSSNGHHHKGNRAQTISKHHVSAMRACFARGAYSPKAFAGCRKEFERPLSSCDDIMRC
jgi:hypothetical protein